MNKQNILIIILLLSAFVHAQKDLKSDLLFSDQTPLEIKLGYSNKDLDRKTDDSTFIHTSLQYLHEEKWLAIEVDLRARGNFRRSTCYFPPVKMKIKKAQYKGTLFDGNKSMKLVMPCKLEKASNDNVLQEFIAYKIYEKISPYHFKTRRVNIDFKEAKGKKKVKEFQLTGFFIEDNKRLAKRFEARPFERYVHPMAMQHLTSVHIAFFQYLLGNTDFSTAYQHNSKLMYMDKQIIPLPYDFDMTGWVNPSYATVNETLGIKSVQDRKYRGLKREQKYFDEVRKQLIDQKSDITNMVASFEADFSDPKEYENMFTFMELFYDVLEDDGKFKKSIVDQARTK